MLHLITNLEVLGCQICQYLQGFLSAQLFQLVLVDQSFRVVPMKYKPTLYLIKSNQI